MIKKFGLNPSGDAGMVWFISLVRCRTMCGLSQKYSGDVKPNRTKLLIYEMRFGLVWLTSPEYFCDNPHIVRRLQRDQKHDKKFGLNPSGDAGMEWFISLGRCRTMCGLSQKYSGDVKSNWTKLLICEMRFGLVWLTSPEYFCDNPHIVRRLPRDQNHEKSLVWIPRETQGWYGLDSSEDVVLCVGYRRNTRETSNETEPNYWSMRWDLV